MIQVLRVLRIRNAAILFKMRGVCYSNNYLAVLHGIVVVHCDVNVATL